MNISQSGINLIKHFEGVRLKSYQDSAGVYTIGYGSTRYATGKRVGPDETITEQVADILLTQKLNQNDAVINALVKVPITQNQHDALASFEYNVGDGALRTSTLLKLLNAKDYHGAAIHFTDWDKITVKGQKEVSQDLLKRRQEEAKLFLS